MATRTRTVATSLRGPALIMLAAACSGDSAPAGATATPDVAIARDADPIDGGLATIDATLADAPLQDAGEAGADADSPDRTLEQLVIAAATGPGSAPFLPSRAIDGDESPESRWSAEGIPQSLTLDLGAVATVHEVHIAWHRSTQRQAFFELSVSIDGASYAPGFLDGASSGAEPGFETYGIPVSSARFVRIVGRGNSENEWNSIREVRIFGQPNGVPPPPTPTLDPDLPPGSNFELIDWYLNTPDDGGDGRSARISERQLAAGYADTDYFYTAADGGMVFRATVAGARTSANTSYVRTELREMLRRGNESIPTRPSAGRSNRNNWVFSSAPESARQAAGGVDGLLRATVAVDHVTTTGNAGQVGRVIIGQIHAEDDEPCRLYYRKLPGNTRGSVYYAHELRGGDDLYRELIGSRSNSAADPDDGIALKERFTYEIEVEGNLLTVRLLRPNKPDIVDEFDMSGSGYDIDEEFMYFKAGAYIQDNTGLNDDYAQVTFYELSNTHTGYPF